MQQIYIGIKLKEGRGSGHYELIWEIPDKFDINDIRKPIIATVKERGWECAGNGEEERHLQITAHKYTNHHIRSHLLQPLRN